MSSRWMLLMFVVLGFALVAGALRIYNNPIVPQAGVAQQQEVQEISRKLLESKRGTVLRFLLNRKTCVVVDPPTWDRFFEKDHPEKSTVVFACTLREGGSPSRRLTRVEDLAPTLSQVINPDILENAYTSALTVFATAPDASTPD